jgi:hypothetical protein
VAGRRLQRNTRPARRRERLFSPVFAAAAGSGCGSAPSAGPRFMSRRCNKGRRFGSGCAGRDRMLATHLADATVAAQPGQHDRQLLLRRPLPILALLAQPRLLVGRAAHAERGAGRSLRGSAPPRPSGTPNQLPVNAGPGSGATFSESRAIRDAVRDGIARTVAVLSLATFALIHLLDLPDTMKGTPISAGSTSD